MPIYNVKKKMTKASERLGFEADEIVAGACMTFPAGHKRKTAIHMGVGGVTTMSRDRPGSDGAAAKMPSGHHFLAVTNYRLIVTSIISFWTNPKEIVAQWPIDEVRSIAVQPGVMAAAVQVLFVDGSAFELDGARSSGAEDLDGILD